jgi:uncharacterized membrane protein
MRIRITIQRAIVRLRALLATRRGVAAVLGLIGLFCTVCLVATGIETDRVAFYFYAVCFAAIFTVIALQYLYGEGDDFGDF